jgi:hypothetical protein
VLPRLLILTLVSTQAAAVSPIRIGPTARRLTDADVVEIQNVLGRDRLWVVIAHRGQIGTLWAVSAFLAPSRGTAELRRGKMSWLTATLDEFLAYSKRGPWRSTPDFPGSDYVQVPIPGRDPGEVVDSRDLHRPIRVLSEFRDDELLSIVRFIRTSPTAPPDVVTRNVRAPAPDVFTRVHGDWPIDTLSRESNGNVVVRLIGTDENEMSGQHVTLRPAGGGWSIVQMGPWYH